MSLSNNTRLSYRNGGKWEPLSYHVQGWISIMSVGKSMASFMYFDHLLFLAVYAC
ncbi:hypothetical protein NC652_026699 [Populus alba x Populus x berolinensis]|nr:hypothetical protein NC652_026699 [Populus alba x Populus x berolinensis]